MMTAKKYSCATSILLDPELDAIVHSKVEDLLISKHLGMVRLSGEAEFAYLRYSKGLLLLSGMLGPCTMDACTELK